MKKDKLDEVSEEMASVLRKLYNQIIISEKYNKEINPLNPQIRILKILMIYDKMTISQICKKLNISKPNMTLIIDKLEKNKLAERILDSNDRRKIYISITKKGIDFSNKSSLIIKEILKENLKKLNKNKINELHNSIQCINETITEVKNE